MPSSIRFYREPLHILASIRGVNILCFECTSLLAGYRHTETFKLLNTVVNMQELMYPVVLSDLSIVRCSLVEADWCVAVVVKRGPELK